MSSQPQFTFLDSFAPIFYEDKTYWLISGGRASGKSTQVSAYFLMRLMQEGYFRGVIARYTQRSISSSIYRDILDLIQAWGLNPLLKISGDEIVNPKTGNMILTHSMKISEGTSTAKGKGLSNVTHLLIDEATEIPSEEEYIKLVDSFRHKGSERKIFLCFNPTHTGHWIHRRFYLPDSTPNPKWTQDHGFLHTTYHSNAKNLDPKKIQEWERMRDLDPDYYEHHIMGRWRTQGEGQVFTNWQWDMALADPDSETIYGLDFGFANDPTALIQVKKRGQRLWIQEIIYETGLTTEDLALLMRKRGVPLSATIVCDSSDPRSIETLKRLGYRLAKPCVKGPDSVRSGIDAIRSYEVHAHAYSENLRHEYENYHWRSGTERPVDKDNHLCDALRYAVGTSLKIGRSTGPVLFGARSAQKLSWM